MTGIRRKESLKYFILILWLCTCLIQMKAICNILCTCSNCLIQFEPDQFNDWFFVFSFHFHQTFLMNLSCSHQTVKVTATGALSRPSLTAYT